jgi:uncharacterized membrane protein
MNILNYLKTEWNLDLIIMLIVIASGFFQDKYLRDWTLSKVNDTNGALKTLIVSGVVSVIYIILLYSNDAFPKSVWAMYFISYFAATSFYELLIKPFRRFLEKKAEEGGA